jgi:WD40 repeat protein
VQPDGSRRLLGEYEEAGWSPRGLFVIAARDRTLVALEADGDPRWSLSRPQPIADPRWSPYPGLRVAYRAGDSLRIIAGDGTDDGLLARSVKPLAPAWRPGPGHVLAFVNRRRELRIVNTDTSEPLASIAALPGVSSLGWAPDGTALVQTAPTEARVTELRPRKIETRLAAAATHPLPLPSGAIVRAAAFSPDGENVALLLSVPAHGDGPSRSEVLLANRSGERARRLFSAPGRLGDLAWSPDGSRLLVTWRDADQWLFIPVTGRGRTTAVDGISSQFSPGAERPSFPSVDVSGWCCPPGG